MIVYIYVLYDPRTDEIRYVGKSVNPKARLRAHITAARNGAYDHHTSRWICKLLAEGVEPELAIVDEVSEGDDWREIERLWITRFETEGGRLTNSTAGGEGLDYRNPEDREKYLSNLRAAMARFRETDAGKAAMERFRASSQTKESREKRSEALREYYRDPENRERCAEMNREISSRSESLRKKGDASRAMWEDPETRAKLMNSFAGENCKQLQSQAKKKAWSDPEKAEAYRAALKAAWADPEKKAARVAKRKATEEATGKKPTISLEALALRNQRIKESWARRKAAKLAQQASV